MSSPQVVALLGPTGIGKTALALALAQRFGGEIVSADSRTFYRGMNIGTAKPTSAERALVTHHLIDIADPDQTVGLAEFQALAHAAILDIHRRGKLALLVGGTGQYVWAVLEGWTVPQTAPDPDLRARLFAQAEREGSAALHASLAEVDPLAASRIDARNVRRVVRALEVYRLTGAPISSVQSKTAPPYRTLILGLDLDRPALYARVDARIDAMLAVGLEQEVRSLVAAGYGFDLPAMSGIGYGEWASVLAGQATVAQAAQAMRRDTRRFIRHQSAWFRRADPRIHWLDASNDPFPAASALVETWVAGAAP